jgi:hypothetical protein
LTVKRSQLIELEPGEELLAVARASFRGAAATSVRATFALGSGRTRLRAFDVWHDAAIASGFPFVPPDMVVTATPQRVLFGKPTFWGRTPSRCLGVARPRDAFEHGGIGAQDLAPEGHMGLPQLSRPILGLLELTALEKSDLTRLPAPVFTRGFIRSYRSAR